MFQGDWKKAIPDWNVSGRLEESDGSYGTHYWIANDGKYCPADLREVEGYVCNKDNPGEVFQEFKINNVSGNIEELKAFVGNQAVSLDEPFVMQGSSSEEVYLKAKAEGSEEFKTIPAGAWSHECTSGHGFIKNGTQGSIFMLTEDGEATFRLSMYEDPDNLSVDFKAISNKVPVEKIQVNVPDVWYIDSWNSLADYYVGITRGQGENNFNYSFTPGNATNQNLIWEAKTPEIAEYMEAFGNGIVPKKAGLARFHVYSEENPGVYQDVSVEFKYKYPLEIAEYMEAFGNGIVPKKAGLARFHVYSEENPGVYQDVSVEFKYKYPLKKVQSEKEVYELEEGANTKVKITATPENATEQRFDWTYNQEGIVEMKSSVSMEPGVYELEEGANTKVKITATPENATEQRFDWTYNQEGIVEMKSSVSMEPGDVNAPKITTHTIKAQKAGVVTVTGTPMDTTGGCKPIQFTVRVSKNGVVPGEGDYLKMTKEDIRL